MSRTENCAGLDTSFMVALLCDWHEYHNPALAAWQDLRGRRVRVIVPVHSLLETYSVLTRLPAQFRLSPKDARHLLEANFTEGSEVSGLTPEAAWSSIRRLADRDLGGGRIYDAVIAAAAFQAGAQVMLTWNSGDFFAVAPPGIAVREPGPVQ
jgi:predicted nucleic acid-binding protein